LPSYRHRIIILLTPHPFWISMPSPAFTTTFLKGRSVRQVGQVNFTFVHWSRQRTWNICFTEHGSLYTLSSGSTDIRHIAHSPSHDSISSAVAFLACTSRICCPSLGPQQHIQKQKKSRMIGATAIRKTTKRKTHLQYASSKM